MTTSRQTRRYFLIALSLALSIGLPSALPPLISGGTAVAGLPSRQDRPTPSRPHGPTSPNAVAVPCQLVEPLSYPPDPTADTAWSAGTGGVSDIQAAFNHARAAENAQLGTSIPMLTLPSQAEWDGKSDGEKALWLINRERIDRGIHPLHGVEENVTDVAQSYADYLLANNVFNHNADGRNPWERLDDNPAIGACHDFLSRSENLHAFSSTWLPVERSVYWALYRDSDCCWEHRHTILWYPYNDNGGPAGREGFLGIGRASGGPYLDWSHAEVIVLNVFDPCASWDYGAGAALSSIPDSLTFVYSIPDQRLLSGPRRVTPENEGNQETLTWQIATSGTWFTASPLQGTTPNSLWITPTAFSTSAVATYTGALTVTIVEPAGVEGSPHTTNLTLRVVDVPFSDIYLPLAVRSCVQ